MDLQYIRDCVASIEAMRGDPESAHGHEDQLRAEFIGWIARNSYSELAEMAREVLKTDAMDFPRWYA